MITTRNLAAVPALALLLAVSLTAPAFGATGVNGAVEEGSALQAPQMLTIGVNAGWSSTSTVPPAFFWSGAIPVFSSSGPFDFTLATDGCVSVTDDFIPGDQFRIYDNANAIGETPVVPSGGPDVDNGPDVAYFDPAYSSATFVVGPGSHSITIEVIGASLSGGRGYIRVDGPGNFAPCDALLLPDLVVDSLTHFPANPDTEDTIQFTAVVKNIGGAAAGSSVLSFKIGGESPSDPAALFDIPSLNPGQTETVVRNEGLSVAQNYTNTAVADFNNDVAESNEANNTTTDSYTVTQAVEASGVVYSITDLPDNGTLFDSAGTEITTPGQSIPDVMVTYEPDPGFEGTDMFTYRCTDSTDPLLFDEATVDIIVSSPGSGDDLMIDIAGAGVGDVAVDVGGSIVAVCTSDCTVSVGAGNFVKLQARPVGLDVFGSWGVDCSGTSQIFTFTMPSGGASCSATFNNP